MDEGVREQNSLNIQEPGMHLRVQPQSEHPVAGGCKNHEPRNMDCEKILVADTLGLPTPAVEGVVHPNQRQERGDRLYRAQEAKGI